MKPPRVVLDTNVLISAILFGGPPRQVLERVITGSLDCSLSLAICDELRDVLQRPKFGFSAQMAVTVVEELCSVCEIVNPSGKVDVIKADPDDNRVIECALEAKADFIVSGDAHLLELGSYADIRILSPSDFLRSLADGTKPHRRGR